MAVALIVIAALVAYRSNQNAKRAEAASQLATQERARAEAQRDEAERQKNIALARQLSARSEVLLGQRGTLLETSALLAGEALRRFPSIDADHAIRHALALLPKRVAAMHVRKQASVRTV